MPVSSHIHCPRPFQGYGLHTPILFWPPFSAADPSPPVFFYSDLFSFSVVSFPFSNEERGHCRVFLSAFSTSPPFPRSKFFQSVVGFLCAFCPSSTVLRWIQVSLCRSVPCFGAVSVFFTLSGNLERRFRFFLCCSSRLRPFSNDPLLSWSSRPLVFLLILIFLLLPISNEAGVATSFPPSFLRDPASSL